MAASIRKPGAHAPVVAGAALIALSIAARQYLELTMARHMLMQIPMLLAGGMFLGCYLARMAGQDAGRRFAAWNENGLPGLFSFLLVTAFWMVPKALDEAIASGSMEQAKILSLVIAGMVLAVSLARANTIIQLFFLGNFSSMTAVIGMLYQEANIRLCNAYLQDDQQNAGVGLVVSALALPLLWYLLRRQGMLRGPDRLSAG